MKTSLHTRVSRLEAGTEAQRIATLRQTIADLEQRKTELLADLTTLEEALAARQRRVSPPKRGQKGTAERGTNIVA